MIDMPAATDEALRRLKLVVSSFHRLTGQHLIDPNHGDEWQACWTAPRVIVAHGTEADPIFFYGNRSSLSLFELDFEAFTQLPSRYSAEAMLREKRDAVLARVREHGYVDGYEGVRVSASGRRFRIEQAVIWDVLDEAGAPHGQAATFERWVPLPEKAPGMR